MWAARVWRMLRWIGFDDAALLDGGLKYWKAEGRPLEVGLSASAPARSGSLPVSPRPELIADRHEVAAIIEADGSASAGACLIDALPSAVYRGEVRPYARPGHIPTAVNLPAASMVDRETGRFRPVGEIEAMLAAALPDRPEARTVVY